MAVSFVDATARFKEQTRLRIQRQKYTVYDGEVPWWQVEDIQERYNVRHRQYYRAYNGVHPEVQDESNKKYTLTHVGTSKAPGGLERLYAPYKRSPVDACELCEGSLGKLGWHHWANSNPSVGLWACLHCNCFAEAVDNDNLVASRYAARKKSLDGLYEDGIVVKAAKLAKQARRIGTNINGTFKMLSAYGKRARLEDKLCELCNKRECYNYHHWDDAIPGKGLWVCTYDHWLAERIDAYGEAFVDKYLTLKVQDELRVLALMKLRDIKITPSMFPSLELAEVCDNVKA